MENYMEITFSAISQNEAFARAAVSMFASQLNPTIDELDDIKTAVSEAVTNAIVHGYPEKKGTVHIACTLSFDSITVTVSDEGCGIADIPLARTPLYTGAKEGERSGLGFTVMETFMDSVFVESSSGNGTRVTMKKQIAGAALSSACV